MQQDSAFAGPQTCNHIQALEEKENKLLTLRRYIRMNEEGSDQLELLVDLQTLVRSTCTWFWQRWL